MNVNEYLSNWAACYKKDLTENILPFWLKNGLCSVAQRLVCFAGRYVSEHQ